MKKFRLVYVVNYTQYKDVQAKDEDEADELLSNSNTDDGLWEFGKDYSESYVEDIQEEDEE